VHARPVEAGGLPVRRMEKASFDAMTVKVGSS